MRDEVPSLYPTTGSAFPMDVGQRVAGCAVRVISRLGRFFEKLSENQMYANLGYILTYELWRTVKAN